MEKRAKEIILEKWNVKPENLKEWENSGQDKEIRRSGGCPQKKSKMKFQEKEDWEHLLCCKTEKLKTCCREETETTSPSCCSIIHVRKDPQGVQSVKEGGDMNKIKLASVRQDSAQSVLPTQTGVSQEGASSTVPIMRLIFPNEEIKLHLLRNVRFDSIHHLYS
jgi:hypothetical protein